MLEINTGQLRNRKKVLIDSHEYTVRKLGAGEELQISQMAREMEKLTKKDATKLTDKEADRGVELANAIFAIMVSTFDDGLDGTMSKELIGSLTQGELQELYAQIFAEPTAEAEPNKGAVTDGDTTA